MTELQHLTESEQRELNELAKKTDDASLDRFCELLSSEVVTPEGIPWSEHELRESFKRLRPDASERELEIMVTGKMPSENKEWLI
jgi:hypothetical protein